MSKKVILSVTNDLVGDQRVHKISMSLLKFGYDVTLIGRKFKDSAPVTRKYRTKRLKLIFNKRVWFYAEYNIRLFFFLLFHHFDIYVANDLDTLLPNFIVSKLKRKKLVYDSHELFTEVVELNTRPHQKKVWLLIEKFVMPKSLNNITVCDSIAEYYKKKYGNDFIVIKNVPPKKESSLPDRSDREKKIVIYQGALNIGRGIEMLIESFNYIDNAVLWIVGSGDIEKELKELVQKMHLAEKVIFKGRIPLEELDEITASADLGVSLEEDASLSYHYALPNKLFDYIHANIPVIVSDLPEMRKIVEHYRIGEVLKQRTPESLAKLISDMLFGDAEAYERCRWNTKQAMQELNWSIEEQKLEQFYNNLR